MAADMRLLFTTSLEPFLGTYRIVWDSESCSEPRTPSSPRPADLRDGVITLTHPDRSHEWPKEPSCKQPPVNSAPTVPVVLRLFDTYLGADRTASRLTPSTCASHGKFRLGSDSSSSLLSRSSSPSSSSSSGSSLWRFNWDQTFPRLGFRFEGMDVTTAWGHTLSFSHILDDDGHPFAVVQLRPIGGEGGDFEQTPIVVIAKRQRDRFGRVGLTDTERVRLGMRDAPHDT